MKIVSVFNRDGKFSSFVEAVSGMLCLFNLSCSVGFIANFLPSLGLQIFPSVMDTRLIQAVVRIWGLCKLSVFLIVMENSPRLSKQFLEFCACSICLAQLDCNFLFHVCGILIWCKLSLFLFDSHCHDRSALPVFICWWEI